MKMMTARKALSIFWSIGWHRRARGEGSYLCSACSNQVQRGTDKVQIGLGVLAPEFS